MAWAIGGVAAVLALAGAFVVGMLLGYACGVIEKSGKKEGA